MVSTAHLGLRDIARLAGVSPATVSRVLGGYTNVSPSTRDRVIAVVSRFDYQPNRLAKHLRHGRADVVGVVVSDIENPYFATLVRVVEDALFQRGIRVLLCNTSEDAGKQASYLEVMAGERVRGVVLSPSDPQDPQISRLVDLGIPVVTVDRLVAEPRTDSVTADDMAAAREATRVLIGAGHERIGFVAGRTEVQTGAERLSGYRETMSGAGLREAAGVGNFSIKGGAAATEELLTANPDLTALIIANNQMALGALGVLRRRGIRIPQGLAIIAFDDPPWAQLIEPPLTTLARPLRRMAEAAVDLLFERMKGARLQPARVVFEFEMRVRASSGGGVTGRGAPAELSSWEPG
jgi:LacI family transcriptional regulator